MGNHSREQVVRMQGEIYIKFITTLVINYFVLF